MWNSLGRWNFGDTAGRVRVGWVGGLVGAWVGGWLGPRRPASARLVHTAITQAGPAHPSRLARF